MNIHFNDKGLFEELKKQSIANIEIGSKMYGTENKDSDTDILYIYIPSLNEQNSVAVNYYQYQFKENGIDHIFTDIYTFIKNSLNGDSTINFEVINSNKLIGTTLEWLYVFKDKFRNYKILRAYLGRARKDLKQMKSKSTIEEMTKKLSHSVRCLQSAEYILEDSFLSSLSISDVNELTRIRNFKNKRTIHEFASNLENKITLLRTKVNCLLDDGKLDMEQYASEADMRFIDMMLRAVVCDFRENNKDTFYFSTLSNYLYDAVSNGIVYKDSNVKVK